MTELELKYGCNPNQKPARIFMEEGDLPLKVLNGRPGYINFMDALNSWQLVKALKKAIGLPAAASFKHVSPAGAALGLPLSDVERRIYFAPEGELSPIARAYIRARGADRLCSFGAVSYTHLDVYKRQPSPLPAGLPFGCPTGPTLPSPPGGPAPSSAMCPSPPALTRCV